MKNHIIKSGMAFVTLGTALFPEQMQADGMVGHFNLSYRAAFNVSAKFSGLGGYTSPNSPGGAGRITGASGDRVRTYDDGFIGIDISLNAGGSGTYWGYNSDTAQVVSDTVRMHNSSSPATARSGSVDDGAQHGVELSYQYPVGGGEKWRWGVEGALNWMDLKIRDGRPLAGDVMTVTHAFALNGVTPPVAPPTYVGPVDGPGATRLGDTATDVSGPLQVGAASIIGSRSIKADLYGLRVGPYLEFDLGKRVSVALSGGFSGGLIDSEFEYNNRVTISGVGSRDSKGRDQSMGWLFGGYVRGQVSVQLSRAVSLFGGVEFSSLSSFTQSAGAAQASLDLGAAVYVSGGLGYNF